MRQVLYVSRRADPGDQDDIDAIFHRSRHNSAINGITGLLWVCGSRYLQVIEGDPLAVEVTMSRITADARHYDVDVMIDRDVDRREFQSYLMAFCYSGETAV